MPRIGGMATMPSRAHTVEAALASILPQVDRLYLYLDKYEGHAPPAIFDDAKIVKIPSWRYPGMGGTGKFIGIELHSEPCLYYSFDDDIFYPPDYVETLTRALCRHHMRAVVGIHATFFQPPHRSYVRDRVMVHFRRQLYFDCHVDELGSGTMAFYTPSFRFEPRRWPFSDMCDLMIAIEAVRQGVPKIAIRRPGEFVRPLEQYQSDSVYHRTLHDDARQTKLMREALEAYPLGWQLWPIEHAPTDANVSEHPGTP